MASLLALTVVGLAVLQFAVPESGAVEARDVAELGVSAVGTVGLFGFAYARALWRRAFWRAWFPLAVAWEVVLMSLSFAKFTDSALAARGFVALLLILPVYAALYRYAFSGGSQWQRS